MIPILYDGALYATASGSSGTSQRHDIALRNIYWRTYAQIKGDDSFRLGYLSDCLSCESAETINSTYELKIEYPINGTLADKIKLFFCIEAKVTDEEDYDLQMFRIYKITTKIGKLVIYARHISYDMAGMVCGPVDAIITQTAADASHCFITGGINQIKSNTYRWDDGGFSINFSQGDTTNRNWFHNFKGVPDGYSNPRKLLIDLATSCCYYDARVNTDDVKRQYQIEWNNNVVNVKDLRGSDLGAYINYGVDLKTLEYTLDGNDFKNFIMGYVKDDILYHGVMYPYPDWSNQYIYNNGQIYLADRTQWYRDGESAATACAGVQPSTKVKPYFFAAKWAPVETIKADIIYLAGTDDYRDRLHVDRLHIGDDVRVLYPEGGIDIKTQITAVTYDVLRENYKKITIGSTSKKWYEQL